VATLLGEADGVVRPEGHEAMAVERQRLRSEIALRQGGRDERPGLHEPDGQTGGVAWNQGSTGPPKIAAPRDVRNASA
jgi:hypothetical protein